MKVVFAVIAGLALGAVLAVLHIYHQDALEGWWIGVPAQAAEAGYEPVAGDSTSMLACRLAKAVKDEKVALARWHKWGDALDALDEAHQKWTEEDKEDEWNGFHQAISTSRSVIREEGRVIGYGNDFVYVNPYQTRTRFLSECYSEGILQ